MTQEPNINPEAMRLMRQLNHDLRNSLNTVLATANMLTEGIYEPLTDRQTRAVQRLERSSQRMLTVLDDLIAYAKAQTGEYVISPTDFDPSKVLEAVVTQTKPVAEAKGLEISLKTMGDVPTSVFNDPAIIERLLSALVWNAISFTTSGSIQITSAWSDTWLLTVEDTGPGIPPEDLPHLFEPFWRGQTPASSVPTAGNGLGLATAQVLSKVVGGELKLSHSDSTGSAFDLRLPLRHAAPAPTGQDV